MRMPTVKITNTDEGLLVEQVGGSNDNNGYKNNNKNEKDKE